ncbi:DUF262 domain-containing protein [Robertmurraya korlensis]|uniref:DUF262 domain-containing protein n=1 Tax=Robertmurraya korlensis TaxID=519977 RepID=UPI000824FFAF|nr:DUF262 domain-containing protein [Robertmurraya korlensis]
MVQNNLKSINDIFENRLFRIPDYQRGYAWEKGQLVDFWEDLNNLRSNRPHYTGVITLEPVNEERLTRWEEESWIIERGHKAYYVVDGQQRLTTIMILIQAILEQLPDDQTINHYDKQEIRKKYICHYTPGGVLKAFLFGYEKDNPSYEYLKTQIFNEESNSNQSIETLYTKNLHEAKEFFSKKLKSLTIEEISEIFKKVTLQLKFNIFEIEDQVDVFIAFETMNNRGKKLSTLELLKNRLIYLTTILTTDEDLEGSANLRNNINECWKTIYEYLGKNKQKPLDDDTFLKNHWIMYFGYTRDKANAYADFLLNEHFIAKQILDNKLSGKDIQNYVTSLQNSIKKWFYLYNPDALSEENSTHTFWLRKLNRLRFGAFAPLAMAALLKCDDDQLVTKLLKSMERYIFVVFRISQRKSNTGDSHFYKEALKLYYGKNNINDVIAEIEQWITWYIDIPAFKKHIEEKFKFEGNGYYGWSALKYFLYEYELKLQGEAGKGSPKLSWSYFEKTADTIEHILPHQASKDCWTKDFEKFDSYEQKYLRNSIGNLLALSRSKNSSLKNSCFKDKKVQPNGQKGYFNGSYSEISVNQYDNWTPYEIKDRGLKMLKFLNERWNLNISDDNLEELLFLSFLEIEENADVM